MGKLAEVAPGMTRCDVGVVQGSDGRMSTLSTDPQRDLGPELSVVGSSTSL